MRLPLVGQAYPARSLAVSAQECCNVYPSLIEDPNESSAAQTAFTAATGKNHAALYGCPGKHLGATLAGDVRGLWSGAGRLLVANGINLTELNQAWGVQAPYGTRAFTPPATDDGKPVQIFSNGNQLLIISGGVAYCDNGAGPQICTTEDYAGVVNILDPTTLAVAVVGWVSGDKFLADGSWSGRGISLGGSPYVIDHVSVDPVYCTNGASTQLFLKTPISPYFANESNIAYTATGDTLTAVTGGVMNGTFFVQRPPTVGQPAFGAQINFSAVLNGLSGDPLNPAWSGLDFFRKEGAPDNIVGILTDNNQLYAFGAETFEVYTADPNAGVDGQPFVSIVGAMGHFGTLSPWAVASLDGKVYFLGGDDKGGPILYYLNGFTPVAVSTNAEESAWRTAGLGRNAVAYAYNEGGTSFLMINFGAQTWGYDPSTGAWHSRLKWTAGAFAPYLTNLHTFIPEWGAGGVHVTACSTGPANVYESNLDFFDDEGTDIAWRRALPYQYNGGKRLYFGRLDLDMETGTVATGSAPLITYDYSDDRGKTYINPRTSTEGLPGETAHRVYWNRNGSSMGRVLRFFGVGQSKVVLIDLQCDLTMGTA